MPQLDLYLWNVSVVFYFILFFVFYFFVLNFFLIKIIKNFYFRKFFINKVEFENKYLIKFENFIFKKGLFNYMYLLVLNNQLKYINFYKFIVAYKFEFMYFIQKKYVYSLFKNILGYNILNKSEFNYIKFIVINLLINEKFF